MPFPWLVGAVRFFNSGRIGTYFKMPPIKGSIRSYQQGYCVVTDADESLGLETKVYGEKIKEYEEAVKIAGLEGGIVIPWANRKDKRFGYIKNPIEQ